MKIQLERDGEIIEVDRLRIIFEGTEYTIKETASAYKETGNFEINKNSFDSSSSISITPSVSNLIYIK